jgi:RHS repeat-associated protein
MKLFREHSCRVNVLQKHETLSLLPTLGRACCIGALVFCAATPMFANQATVTVQGFEHGSANLWDAGTLTVIVNGQSESFSFGQFSTAASVASGIAARFAQDCGSWITAKATGSSIVFVEKHSGGAPLQIDASAQWNTAVSELSSFSIVLPQDGIAPPATPETLSLYLSCTPNPIPSGATAVCSAQLPEGPTGTVTFTLDGVSWSSASVDATGLAVSSGLTSITPGTAHTVVASYSGDSNYVATTGSFSLSALNSGTLPSASPVYSYSFLQSDHVTTNYAPNGNILAYTDSVNGIWSLGYDGLNRLVASAQIPVGSTTVQYGCWSYDSFGNLKQEYFSTSGFGSQLGQACVQTPGATVVQTDMAYADGTNRITSGGWKNRLGTFNSGSPSYDASGNMSNDLQNQYLYDTDGNVCAVQQPTAYGIAGPLIGYLYNAEGERVAKGTLTSFSCDPTSNGFQATNVYVIGPDGQEMTEVDGSGNWVHTNVSAGGSMIATYKNDGQGVHFQLADWLGTRRVQTDYLGQTEDTFQSQPYGDEMIHSNAGADVSDHHFTGKERDTESGNDYFDARYFGSSMGRFMSPDPSGLLAANPSNPQSWNMYAYVMNNPLINTDPTGLDCVYYNDAGTGLDDGPGADPIDHDSSSSECGSTGGNWVEGTTSASLNNYDAASGTWMAASYDGSNAYIYSGVAPGGPVGDNSQVDSCQGNCLSGNSAPISSLMGQLQYGGTLVGLLQYAVSQPMSAGVSASQSWIAESVTSDGGRGVASGYCGHGGAGVPGNSNGWGCLAHDYEYSITGNAWPGGNYNPNYPGGPQLQKINQTLCNNVSGFGGLEIKAFFTASVWGCRP